MHIKFEKQQYSTSPNVAPMTFIFFFKILFIYLQREGKGERKRRGQTSMCERSVASCMRPTGYLDHNPGMCPDWESNQ